MASTKRERFIRRAETLLGEIDQIFVDAEHWNRCVRKADEELIDPDPNGDLAAFKKQLERFLESVKSVESVDKA